jgi:hypothetical protein
MATRHELKTWPPYFAAIRAGTKRFELRKNDRAFQIGDTLVLREFDPGPAAYTGQVEERVIEYILGEDEAMFGFIHGFVALGFGATLETAGAVARAAGDLTLSDLARWHASQADSAAARAETNRRVAASTPRFAAVAVAAQGEADFHAMAAELLRQSLAGVAAGDGDREQAA